MRARKYCEGCFAAATASVFWDEAAALTSTPNLVTTPIMIMIMVRLRRFCRSRHVCRPRPLDPVRLLLYPSREELIILVIFLTCFVSWTFELNTCAKTKSKLWREESEGTPPSPRPSITAEESAFCFALRSI